MQSTSVLALQVLVMSKIEKIFFKSKSNYLFKVSGFYDADFALSANDMIRQHLIDESATQKAKHGLVSDEFRKDKIWYDNIQQSAIDEILSLKPNYTHALFPPMMRRVAHERSEVPWHQDKGYQANLGERGHLDILTIFVYLSSLDKRRSRLMFMEHDLGSSDIEHFDNGKAANPIQISDNHLPAGELICPELDLGDALIFGDETIHKTTPYHNNFERSSIEFRVANKKAIKPERDYFNLADFTWQVS